MAQTPAVRHVQSAAMNTTTRVATVALPTTGTTAPRYGDWLIAVPGWDWGSAATYKAQTIGGTAGTWLWRETGNNNTTVANQVHTGVWTRQVTGGTAGAIAPAQTVTSNGTPANADVVLHVIVIDGSTTEGDPVDAVVGILNGGAAQSVTPVTPEVDPVESGDLLVAIFASQNTTTIGAPAGMTALGTATSSRTYITQALFRETWPTANPTGQRQGSFSPAPGRGYASVLLALHGKPDAVVAPTAPKLSTLTDRFPTLSATLWPTRTNSGGASPTHDAKRRALSVPVTMVGANPNYAAARSAEAYSFAAPTTFSFRIVLAPEGGTANAQAWLKAPDASGVARAGFELRAVTGQPTQLDFVAQGAGYASVGTTESIPYDEHVHRWCMLEVSSAGHLIWYTSVDSITWTVRRSLAAAEVPPWITTRNDLAGSFEGFRTAGTSSGFVYAFVVDDVNLPAEAPPTFVPALTGGATLFAPNWAAADNVAAGYTNNPNQRQSRTSGMGDTGVPYPVPITDAPFGRSGRAMPFRIPDDYRRLEVTPPTEYGDGEQLWVGFAFLVEGDMDRVAQRGGYYQIIWQLHHALESGSPPVGLEVRDSRLIVAGGSNRVDPVTGATNTGNTYRYEKYLSTYGNVIPGQWIDVVMGIGLWSAINSGRLDIWVDGVKHLDAYVPKSGTNLPGAGDLAYPKHGIYHDGSNRGCTVWFADYREGTSYAAVAPPAGKVGAFGDVIAEP